MSTKTRCARWFVPAPARRAPAPRDAARPARPASACLAPFLVLLSTSVAAQTPVSLESVDADANGQLTRSEFSNLPGFYAAAELFAEMDLNADRLVSREEWIRGFPDESGNRGSAREALASGTRGGIPEGFAAHGPSIPREKNEEISLEQLPPIPRDRWPELTGHGGANGKKRGVAQTPPLRSPDEPPLPAVVPRTRR